VKGTTDFAFARQKSQSLLRLKIWSFLTRWRRSSSIARTRRLAKKYELRGGVGIAAPQLGVNRRFFTVLLQEEDETFKLSIFNPRITSHSVEQTYLNGGEGCLSVDRVVNGNVPRHRRITLEGFDRDGNPIKLRLRGMRAIVCQHELDHLDGVMFYDRINPTNPLETYGEPI